MNKRGFTIKILAVVAIIFISYGVFLSVKPKPSHVIILDVKAEQTGGVIFTLHFVVNGHVINDGGSNSNVVQLALIITNNQTLYQPAHATNESSYKWGYKSAVESWKCHIGKLDPCSATDMDDDCTPPNNSIPGNHVTNETACDEGWAQGMAKASHSTIAEIFVDNVYNMTGPHQSHDITGPPPDPITSCPYGHSLQYCIEYKLYGR
jgi:hypothetical protein